MHEGDVTFHLYFEVGNSRIEESRHEPKDRFPSQRIFASSSSQVLELKAR